MAGSHHSPECRLFWEKLDGYQNERVAIIERLQLIQGIDDAVACQKMLGKLNYARAEFTFEGTKRDRSA